MARLSNEEIDTLSRKYLELQTKAGFSKEAIKNLSKEEIAAIPKEVIDEFKAHQKICIEKFSFLVRINSAKYRQFSNHPDLEQEGYEALIRSFDSYHPDKGCFTWWGGHYVKTKISRAANAHSTIRYPIKKAKEMMPYKTSVFPVLIDDSMPQFTSCENAENNSLINKALDKLSDTHKYVINMTYGLNGFKERSVNNVIKDLDITKPQYTKLLKEAKEQIKQLIK